jgi:hypothetical protein
MNESLNSNDKTLKNLLKKKITSTVGTIKNMLKWSKSKKNFQARG